MSPAIGHRRLWRNAQLTVLDMTGREVLRRNLGSDRKARVDVSSLVPGGYFIRLQADGAARVARFVRE